MIIHGMHTAPNLLRSATDCGHMLGVAGETYNGAFIRFLEWVVIPKVSICNAPLNDQQGMLFHARSRKAMIKGFRKIYELKRENPQYLLDGQGESIGMVFANHRHNVGMTKVGAGVRIVGHNVAQAGKRFLAKAAIGAKYLQLKTTNKTSNERHESLHKTGQKVINALGVDHYQSFSAINNCINEFQNGFYLFLARTKFLPNHVENAKGVRMIGTTANFGMVATQLETAGEVQDAPNNFLFNQEQDEGI